MIKIAIVYAFENYIDNAREIFEEHNRCERIYNNEECILEEVICSQEELKNLKLDADAIIARGIYAETLEKCIHDKPVIEIPFLATDLFLALRTLRERYGQVKVGILAGQNMVMDSESLGQLAGLSVNTYTIETNQNVDKLVAKAMRDGCEAIAGGTGACNAAEALGLGHMFIKTSKECFWRALTSAKRVVHIARMEQERSGKLQLILDASQNGIMSLDIHKVIDTVNESACKILGIPEKQLSGIKAQDTSLPLPIKKLFMDNNEYTDEIIRLHSSTLTFRKYFIKQGNVNAGCVITFWQVSDISDFENTIRKKIYNKGYVAKSTFDSIIGASPAITKAIEAAKRYALTTSNVLLIGQSGVGKEIFAQSIHNYSERKGRPFLAVNCAAIPENLLESEFFGYAAGAFTGAQKGGKPGYFELAHTGTIFLDEIGEMPLSLQSKLLRVIQEREVIRVGDGTVIPIDVRIISATNRPLEEMVAQGRFREDLFFRLDVLRINIPSLSQRIEDIPLLIQSYFDNNVSDCQMTPEACSALQKYSWHGNIRHLFNICERLSVLKSGAIITAEDVHSVMSEHPGAASPPFSPTFGKSEAESGEKGDILRALEQCHYNRAQTAQLLGINRSTLWRKMKEYGL
ncbi:MAG: sigma 54-interacting transcriptional regulator [Angelakisella sp.]|nr:sigma 54-interacting transcriptional regulator [Angelakisella sp.]